MKNVYDGFSAHDAWGKFCEDREKDKQKESKMTMKIPLQKIQELHYNWYSTHEAEEYHYYIVGKHGVTHILHNSAPERYDVYFEDGGRVTIYNPNEVMWVKA